MQFALELLCQIVVLGLVSFVSAVIGSIAGIARADEKFTKAVNDHIRKVEKAHDQGFGNWRNG